MICPGKLKFNVMENQERLKAHIKFLNGKDYFIMLDPESKKKTARRVVMDILEFINRNSNQFHNMKATSVKFIHIDNFLLFDKVGYQEYKLHKYIGIIHLPLSLALDRKKNKRKSLNSFDDDE